MAEPAQFRMVLISFLAAAIGLLAGLIAFVLYKLIGLFTNIFFYHRFVADFPSARHNQLGLWVILIPVIGGIIVGFMAKYGSSKDQRARHSRGDGSGAGQSQPHRAPSRDSEADFRRDCDRHRRTVRRRRSDHSDRRRSRFACRTGRFTPRLPSARCCWHAARRRACRRLSILRLPA